MAKRDPEDLPATLQRSDEHAQDVYAETLGSAQAEYGDGGRAHRTAFAALKHSYEKVGDHWEAKEEPGPSDAAAERSGPGPRPTSGGVDANATKAHLLGIARRLDVRGRSTMTKAELVDAIERANDRATRAAQQG